MKLYYLNHKIGNHDWMETDHYVSNASTFFEQIAIWQSSDSFTPKGFSHLLIHFPDYQNKFAEKKFDKYNLIDNNSVIFFMSSEGVPFQPFCHDYNCGEKSERHRCYVFGIKKNGQRVTGNEWKSLFTWAKALYEALTKPENMTIEEIVKGMPNDIKELLCQPKHHYIEQAAYSVGKETSDDSSIEGSPTHGYMTDAASFLSAVLILCQGYFMAHEDKGGYGLKGLEKLTLNLRQQAQKFKVFTESKAWWSSILSSDSAVKLLEEEITKNIKDATLKKEIEVILKKRSFDYSEVVKLYDAISESKTGV